MKYNLIRNGSLEALTASGTGNVSLSWSQLESLIDGNTTNSGVVLTASDVLYLEADLSNRIKVDGIYLYASDLTKLANVNFYYKNSAGESYALCTKNVGSYYYATIPDPSAPHYIETIISGIDIELYEFQIFNDDIIVAFGEAGSLYAKYLENTPIGETGSPEAIPIFNNSTDPMPADAYCCIDYTGNDGDNYIEISSSENGTYYGINDGAILEDNKDNSIYKWDMGEHDNTVVESDNIVLYDPTISGGVYISPIFKLDNKYSASYFITNVTTESGTNSVSYNENVYNGTIRIKSSDSDPLDIDEIFWLYSYGTDHKIFKGITYNGNADDDWVTWVVSDRHGTYFTAVDRRTGYVAISGYYDYIQHYGYIVIYDYDGNKLYDLEGGGLGASVTYRINTNMEFDKYGGLWAYSSTYMYLYHFNNKLDTILYTKYDGSAFLYDLAVEMDGDGVWYTDQLNNIIMHLETDGTVLHQLPLSEPRAICGTLDNGCWVIDNTDENAYRYSSGGVLLNTISLERTASRMTTDMNNGFWYINSNHIYHVDSNGIENVNVEVNQPTKIKGGYNGCIVWSENQDYVKYIDNEGSIVRTFTIAGVTSTKCPALFSFRYEDFVEFQNLTNLIPISYDPVWGLDGSLDWKEVKKDGYFLPKVKYHQTEITLRTVDPTTNPSLNKLIISPAIKVQDIQPQTSKNMYIKTVIPDDVDITDYETKLKCWLGITI